jgi:lipopolysaccharide heptosyltransferase I
MRILIVKLGSIGDIVHTLPSLAAIRSAMPEAEISWVAERRCLEILRDNPLIDRLIEVDTKVLRRGLMSGETLRAPRQQLRRLRASAFDVALDFQGLLKSAAIARLSGARRVFGYSRHALREPASALLLSSRVEVAKNLHVIRKGLELVKSSLKISVPTDANDFSFPISIDASSRTEVDSLVKETQGSYAILNPGGGWPTKLWNPNRFGRLADALWANFGLHSLVTYGPGEEELASSVINSASSGHARSVLLSLKGFHLLARTAKVYIGGDTGPTHLAVAARAPIVGLFGPTEWWRNGSPYIEDICVERNDIGCRVDCHRRACGQWICMDIEVDEVIRAVDRRLTANGRKSTLLPLAG